MIRPITIAQAEFVPETGKLLIQSGNNYQPRFLLTSWEQGLDLFQETAQGWTFLNQSPNILLLSDSHSPVVQSSLNSFCAMIPLDIQTLAAPYKWRQLDILRLLCVNQRARDLAMDCPVLFWMLADSINELDLTLNKANVLILKRRDLILKCILGHTSRSLVRFLKKLRPSSYNHQEISLVYRIISSPESLSLLLHCREVHLNLLKVAMERPECARVPLVRSLLEQPDNPPFLLKSIIILVNACLRVVQKHLVPDLWTSLSRCRSLAELERVNQEINNRYNQRYIQQKVTMEEEKTAVAVLSERTAAAMRLKEEEKRRAAQPEPKIKPKFPPPPFPGNCYIKPITTPEALKYEGSKGVMDNCVRYRDYVERIFKGEIYIYRVYKPQRCTLEIAKTPSGGWLISQLKLRQNASPRQESKNIVQEWLDVENQKKNQDGLG